MDQGLSSAAIRLLIKSSRKAIPFNIILASVLVGDLIYNKVPWTIVGSWFLTIIILSLVRWVFCGRIINEKLYIKNPESTLRVFLVLTLFMGMGWGSCYLLSLPYVSDLHEFIIILVLGGMCAGAIASLSIYLASYYAYVLPMFLPVIVYNFSSLNIDRMFLATMFTLFVVMLMVTAKINSKLLEENIQLSHDKDSLIRRLQKISITDPLTGSYNRRYFESTFPKEINRAKRSKQNLNLIFIDVDNFKLINDNLGHPSGDKLLINLANILKTKLKRSSDIIFRLGGDEFAAIVSNQSLKETLSICNHINSQFKKNLLRNANNIILPKEVALSMGVVNIQSECASDMKDTINIVDKALYEAKNSGKNQIVVKTIN